MTDTPEEISKVNFDGADHITLKHKEGNKTTKVFFTSHFVDRDLLYAWNKKVCIFWLFNEKMYRLDDMEHTFNLKYTAFDCLTKQCVNYSANLKKHVLMFEKNKREIERVCDIAKVVTRDTVETTKRVVSSHNAHVFPNHKKQKIEGHHMYHVHTVKDYLEQLGIVFEAGIGMFAVLPLSFIPARIFIQDWETVATKMAWITFDELVQVVDMFVLQMTANQFKANIEVQTDYVQCRHDFLRNPLDYIKSKYFTCCWFFLDGITMFPDGTVAIDLFRFNIIPTSHIHSAFPSNTVSYNDIGPFKYILENQLMFSSMPQSHIKQKYMLLAMISKCIAKKTDEIPFIMWLTGGANSGKNRIVRFIERIAGITFYTQNELHKKSNTFDISNLNRYHKVVCFKNTVLSECKKEDLMKITNVIRFVRPNNIPQFVFESDTNVDLTNDTYLTGDNLEVNGTFKLKELNESNVHRHRTICFNFKDSETPMKTTSHEDNIFDALFLKYLVTYLETKTFIGLFS